MQQTLLVERGQQATLERERQATLERERQAAREREQQNYQAQAQTLFGRVDAMNDMGLYGGIRVGNVPEQVRNIL